MQPHTFGSSLLAVALSALLASPLAAQQEPDAGAAPSLRVFLDCQRCDFDYFRREVPAVDWVRDRQDSDLHVLITQETTGGGGQEYTLHYLGRASLEGRADTLSYVSRQIQTQDEVRAGLVRTFRLGLARYLALVGLGDRADLIFSEDGDGSEEEELTREQDPWNLWVFRTSVSAEVEGETRTRSRSYQASFSAGRTTAAHKVDFNFWGEYEWDEFELSDGDLLTSIQRDVSLTSTSVWSVSPHWSVGGRTSAGTSTQRNQDFSVQGGPAIEYSVYPYAESSRRQITALYQVAFIHHRYDQLTLFEQMSETRPEHRLEISADFQQPWGELFLSLEGSHFLDNPDQHRVELRSNVEIRLFRGVNLDVRGNVARIKDQIYVAAGDIPDEEILLERRELGTDFEYELDVGLSFTFGSVFNNVVNPRMFGGGGGFF